MEKDKSSEPILNYPIGGYAPGAYIYTCISCENKTMGDKRATQCKTCAINTLSESHSALLKRVGVLESVIRKIKDVNDTIDSLFTD